MRNLRRAEGQRADSGLILRPACARHQIISDQAWTDLLIRSISESVIDGTRFPAFSKEELQDVGWGRHLRFLA